MGRAITHTFVVYILSALHIFSPPPPKPQILLFATSFAYQHPLFDTDSCDMCAGLRKPSIHMQQRDRCGDVNLPSTFLTKYNVLNLQYAYSIPMLGPVWRCPYPNCPPPRMLPGALRLSAQPAPSPLPFRAPNPSVLCSTLYLSPLLSPWSV